jgi:Ca2+-binding RTX toxin-like protein
MALMRVLEVSGGLNFNTHVPAAIDRGDVTYTGPRNISWRYYDPSALNPNDRDISDGLGGTMVYDQAGNLQSGTITTFNESNAHGPAFYIYNFEIKVEQLIQWANANDWMAIKRAALAGDDDIGGSSFADTLSGMDGGDTIAGSGGADLIDGGAGIGYLRG